MTYKLELSLVLPKKKKKLINIKSFKKFVFYGLLSTYKNYKKKNLN